MKDTPGDIEARYQEMLLSLSPAQRIIMACRMFSTARTLVQAHILQENPNIEQKTLREEIFLRFYGHDFDLSERRKILKHLKEISG
jgi:hypothetical protein